VTDGAVDVEALLRRTGAVLEGHFQLTSGRHSPRYIEKFRIMEDPWVTERLCALIAGRFRNAAVQVVLGPAMGGVILAFETARQLGARSVFAEKDADGVLVFDRGFRLRPGERTLVVDDVLTTGGSVRRVLDLVRESGAEVAGVAFLVDRTAGAVDFGVPFFACLSLTIESYAPEECPLCRRGLPLTVT
jgi:orotate phosphoribosyltransferase